MSVEPEPDNVLERLALARAEVLAEVLARRRRGWAVARGARARVEPRRVRDPFADDVLERLAQSSQHYQREHGHYIVPLAERLLEARAAGRAAERRIAELERRLAESQGAPVVDVDEPPGRVFNERMQAEDRRRARAALGIEPDAPRSPLAVRLIVEAD